VCAGYRASVTLPLLGLAGFGLAVVLGIWFLIGILRSGRL